MHKHPLIM